MKRHIRSIDTGFEEDEYLFVYDFEDTDTQIEYDVFINDKKYKISSPVKLESLVEYKSFVRQVSLKVPEKPQNINIKIDLCFFNMVYKTDKYSANDYLLNDFDGEAAVNYTFFSKHVIEHWQNGKLIG